VKQSKRKADDRFEAAVALQTSFSSPYDSKFPRDRANLGPSFYICKKST
jgi:hypothetical protein